MKKLLLLLFIPIVCFGQEPFEGLSFNSLKEAFDYFDKNGAQGYEGIWDKKYEWDGIEQIGSDKLALLKNGNNYYYISIGEGEGPFDKENIAFSSTNNPDILYKGETICPVIPSDLSSEELLRYERERKSQKSEKLKKVVDIANGQKGWVCIKILNDVIIEDFDRLKTIKTVYFKNGETIENIIRMARFYPKNIQKSIPKNKWAGNGSGIILSSSGHIVTNNHVIEDADNIEIEVKLNGEIQKFNAEVVQKDLRNDLAILKIVDVDFDGFGAINYNFKTRSSDVGTKIYTFGYPKALSGMGKEIKVTEGIISSKSGIMGDITTYQITAPIQGGNSGGPLFDDKGNLVGINSSKFNSNETENVNYSIKSSYVLNLIDVLPKSIDLPSSTKLQSLPLTEQIKEISKYVVLVKVK